MFVLRCSSGSYESGSISGCLYPCGGPQGLLSLQSLSRYSYLNMGVSKKNRGTFLGSPYNKDYNIFGFIWGSLILGNYHISP